MATVRFEERIIHLSEQNKEVLKLLNEILVLEKSKFKEGSGIEKFETSQAREIERTFLDALANYLGSNSASKECTLPALTGKLEVESNKLFEDYRSSIQSGLFNFTNKDISNHPIKSPELLIVELNCRLFFKMLYINKENLESFGFDWLKVIDGLCKKILSSSKLTLSDKFRDILTKQAIDYHSKVIGEINRVKNKERVNIIIQSHLGWLYLAKKNIERHLLIRLVAEKGNPAHSKWDGSLSEDRINTNLKKIEDEWIKGVKKEPISERVLISSSHLSIQKKLVNENEVEERRKDICSISKNKEKIKTLYGLLSRTEDIIDMMAAIQSMVGYTGWFLFLGDRLKVTLLDEYMMQHRKDIELGIFSLSDVENLKISDVLYKEYQSKQLELVGALEPMELFSSLRQEHYIAKAGNELAAEYNRLIKITEKLGWNNILNINNTIENQSGNLKAIEAPQTQIAPKNVMLMESQNSNPRIGVMKKDFQITASPREERKEEEEIKRSAPKSAVRSDFNHKTLASIPNSAGVFEVISHEPGLHGGFKILGIERSSMNNLSELNNENSKITFYKTACTEAYVLFPHFAHSLMEKGWSLDAIGKAYLEKYYQNETPEALDLSVVCDDANEFIPGVLGAIAELKGFSVHVFAPDEKGNIQKIGSYSPIQANASQRTRYLLCERDENNQISSRFQELRILDPSGDIKSKMHHDLFEAVENNNLALLQCFIKSDIKEENELEERRKIFKDWLRLHNIVFTDQNTADAFIEKMQILPDELRQKEGKHNKTLLFAAVQKALQEKDPTKKEYWTMIAFLVNRGANILAPCGLNRLHIMNELPADKIPYEGQHIMTGLKNIPQLFFIGSNGIVMSAKIDQAKLEELKIRFIDAMKEGANPYIDLEQEDEKLLEGISFIGSRGDWFKILHLDIGSTPWGLTVKEGYSTSGSLYFKLGDYFFNNQLEESMTHIISLTEKRLDKIADFSKKYVRQVQKSLIDYKKTQDARLNIPKSFFQDIWNFLKVDQGEQRARELIIACSIICNATNQIYDYAEMCHRLEMLLDFMEKETIWNGSQLYKLLKEALNPAQDWLANAKNNNQYQQQYSLLRNNYSYIEKVNATEKKYINTVAELKKENEQQKKANEQASEQQKKDIDQLKRDNAELNKNIAEQATKFSADLAEKEKKFSADLVAQEYRLMDYFEKRLNEMKGIKNTAANTQQPQGNLSTQGMFSHTVVMGDQNIPVTEMNTSIQPH